MSNFKNAPAGLVLQPAQSQAIQFRDDAGNDIVITQADVLQFICPKATAQEVVFFMELCRAQRLNPFIREAFLIKYSSSNPASMVTAEVVFERRANSHPDFRGMESGVVFIDQAGAIQRREGTATYKAVGEKLIGGWARVHRRNRTDSYAEVTLDEYDKHQGLWKSMAGVMINKCAKGVALRLAFPSDFQGMYLEEEIGVAPSVTEVHAEVLPNAPESHGEPQEGAVFDLDEQQAEFNNIVEELASLRDRDTGEVALAVLKSKAVADTGYVVGNDMTGEQLDAAILQAKAWLMKAVSQQDEVEYEQPPLYEEV